MPLAHTLELEAVNFILSSSFSLLQHHQREEQEEEPQSLQSVQFTCKVHFLHLRAHYCRAQIRSRVHLSADQSSVTTLQLALKDVDDSMLMASNHHLYSFGFDGGAYRITPKGSSSSSRHSKRLSSSSPSSFSSASFKLPCDFFLHFSSVLFLSQLLLPLLPDRTQLQLQLLIVILLHRLPFFFLLLLLLLLILLLMLFSFSLCSPICNLIIFFV